MGIMADGDLAEAHGQRVIGEKGPGEQLTLAKEVLDGFCGLYAADNAADGTQYARFFARRHGPGRRHSVKDAAVARTFSRHIGQGLATKADDTGMGKGMAAQYAGIVDEELGREIIRRVDNEIVVLVVDDLGQRLGIDPFIVGNDMDIGIESFQCMAG